MRVPRRRAVYRAILCRLRQLAPPEGTSHPGLPDSHQTTPTAAVVARQPLATESAGLSPGPATRTPLPHSGVRGSKRKAVPAAPSLRADDARGPKRVVRAFPGHGCGLLSAHGRTDDKQSWAARTRGSRKLVQRAEAASTARRGTGGALDAPARQWPIDQIPDASYGVHGSWRSAPGRAPTLGVIVGRPATDIDSAVRVSRVRCSAAGGR